jgi:hypothetical protein
MAAAATPVDSPPECETVFHSVSAVVAALETPRDTPLRLYDFLANPAFLWRRYVQWDDLDEAAITRCADALAAETGDSNARHLRQTLKSCFTALTPAGTCRLSDAPAKQYRASDGAHWIPDSMSDSSTTYQGDRWFCSICHHSDVAKLGQLLTDAKEGTVIDRCVSMMTLDHICCVKTLCDALLHDGTYTHRQNAIARQRSAASAGAGVTTGTESEVRWRMVTASVETIATFGSILDALTTEIRQLKDAVQRCNPDGSEK